MKQQSLLPPPFQHGSPTSRAGASAVAQRAGSQAWRILEALRLSGGVGLTRNELVTRTGLAINAELRQVRRPDSRKLDLRAIERDLWDAPDMVYASTIFTRSRPLVNRLRRYQGQASQERKPAVAGLEDMQ